MYTQPSALILIVVSCCNIYQGDNIDSIGRQENQPNSPESLILHWWLVFDCSTLFTLFSSTVCNYAIARTDTDLISNAVIILFIVDLDKLICDILIKINPSLGNGGGGEAKEDNEDKKQLKTELKNVNEENEGIKKKVQQVEEKIQQDVEHHSKEKGHL